MTEQDAADESGVADRAADQGGESDADAVGPDGVDGEADDGANGDDGGGVDAEAAAFEELAVDPDEDPAEAVRAFVGQAGVEDDLADVEPSVELVDAVAGADEETVASGLSALHERVDALSGDLAEREDEVEDLESRLARKQADFQNYKKRQEKRLEEEKSRATEDLVGRLLDVRDNLQRALEQDEDADIRGGVESTLRQFEDELEREDVAVIDPEPGDATDPQRHEVLMRVESDKPADTVADVHRPGYEMAGKVLRPAQVTVSDGPDEEAEDATDEAEADGDADETDTDEDAAETGDGADAKTDSAAEE